MLVKKQVESLGCPCWDNVPELQNPPASSDDVVVIHAYFYTSDRGSDQVGLRKLATYRTENAANVLFVDDDCKIHQGHIIYNNGITRIDYWLKKLGRVYSYFGTVAKIANIWREHMSQIFIVWTALFSAATALLKAKKYMPRCLAGRWGSVSDVESRLRLCEEHETKTVLGVVLNKRVVEATAPVGDAPAPGDAEAAEAAGPRGRGRGGRGRGRGRGRGGRDAGRGRAHAGPAGRGRGRGRGGEGDEEHQAGADAEELHLDESNAYTAKLGKWSRAVVSAVTDPIFWAVLRVARLSHRELDHFLHWMQVPIGDDEWARDGSKLAQLVCGRADDFLTKFWDVAQSSEWDDIINACAVDDGDKLMLHNLAMELCLIHAAGFYRRIAAPTLRHASPETSKAKTNKHKNYI